MPGFVHGIHVFTAPAARRTRIVGEKSGNRSGKSPKPLKLSRFLSRLRLRASTWLRSRLALAQPPQRARNPRQPPAWPFAGPIRSENSSPSGSSSIPGSSGALTMGRITGGWFGVPLAKSGRGRNSGGGAGGAAGSAGGGAGGASTGAGAGAAAAETAAIAEPIAAGAAATGSVAAGEVSTAASTTGIVAGGELSCAAGGGAGSSATTPGGSAGVGLALGGVLGGASMASLNAVDSTVTDLSDGNAASGVCH
jgi:hypothetical protein